MVEEWLRLVVLLGHRKGMREHLFEHLEVWLLIKALPRPCS